MVIFYLTEQHIYGSARLGMRKPNLLLAKSNEDVEIDLTMSSRTLGEKRYELTNHLGNVLAVVSDKRNGDEPDVVSVSDYYPYGMLMPDRSYDAEEYRYGFNTQEKVSELNSSHTTALFWEYDGRLGRRWNIDPKPTSEISAYSCFSNSPMYYVDLLGDTVAIRYGGFLGIGRKEARYIDDKWVDAKTKNDIDFSVIRNKTKQMIMTNYSELNEISSFDQLTNKINSSRNIILLHSSSGPGGSAEFDFIRYLDDKKKGDLYPDMHIYIPKIYGQKSIVVMAHELGHAWDLLTYRYTNFISVKNSNISKSEVNAMYWENVVRLLHNLPLREVYDINAAPTLKAKITTSITKTLWFGQFKYFKTKISNLDGTQKFTKYW